MFNRKGLVFDIERFAIYDGPGIRTLIFLKGCPLRCVWCANPESQHVGQQIKYNNLYCKQCGMCIAACPLQAIAPYPDIGVKIDWEKCTNCGVCAKTCVYGALTVVGKYMSVEEIIFEVEKDRPFYRRSNGGVTLGGGEPTLQAEFAACLLQELQNRYIHTAIETCGYAAWEKLSKIIRHLDLIYFDIKCIDAKKHQELTGVSNELILSNAEKVSKEKQMIIRVPVIPGCNDSDENIKSTAEFANRLGKHILKIELLPYHNYGESKYRWVGKDFRLKGLERPSKEHMLHLKSIVEEYGVKAEIGRW